MIQAREFGGTMEPLGGKARGLSKLTQSADELGYKVPVYQEITPASLDHILDTSYTDRRSHVARVLNPEVLGMSSELEAIFNRWKGKTIMVRSNSLLEDGNHSFAGVYRSVKIECTTISSLRAALCKVRGSISSREAFVYRHKRKLGGDSVGIVIQEFIEGIEGGYGVIHTSLPQADYCMAISGGDHEAVTDERGTRWRTEVYKHEGELSWHRDPVPRKSYILKLRDISRELEKLHGKSDIEFVIGKDEQIYLLQLRSLNIPPVTPMIEGAEMITRLHDWCPAYFVGLPVLVVESLENLAIQGIKNPLDIPELRGFFDEIPLINDKGEKTGTQSRQELSNTLHMIDPTLKSQGLWDWWDTVAEFNREHPEGWTLAIPNGLPKEFGGLPWSLGGPREAVERVLFSNMKAMVVTAFQATHSDGLAHANIRTREEQVPVINIVDYSRAMNGTNKIELHTGDILSVRKGQLVRDKKSENIEAMNLLEDFHGIHIRDTEMYGQEILFPGIQVQLDKFYNFLATWLEKKQGIKYTKKVLSGIIGCGFHANQDYVNMEIHGFKMHPKYWALQINEDFKDLGLLESLQQEYGLMVDNAKYPEDFEEEVFG